MLHISVLDNFILIDFFFHFFQNFAVELQLESITEFEIEQFKDALNRAGGANYGTGVRDL